MLSESHQRRAEELSISYPQEILLWGYVGEQLGSFHRVQGLSPKHHLAEHPVPGAHLHLGLARGPALPAAPL